MRFKWLGGGLEKLAGMCNHDSCGVRTTAVAACRREGGFIKLCALCSGMVPGTLDASQCVTTVLRTVAYTLTHKALGQARTFVRFD